MASQKVSSQLDFSNGAVSCKEGASNSTRKEKRKEWWSKNKKKLKDVTAEDDSMSEQAAHVKMPTEEGNERQDKEGHRPKLRNRETIAKPDSLKYEPDFNRGFHNKIMQNLYTDTSKKKKHNSESLSKSMKRKPTSPLVADESEDAKKTKNVEITESFDSYKFSLNFINGDVDVSKNAAGKDSKNKYVLFIGNLPFDITKEQLEEHFRKTGGIKSIRIPKEKGTDKGRGFAYMEFDGRISHGIALRLHQTTLGGRKINVEFTSIGGGKSKARKEKLKLKNQKMRKLKMQ